MVLFCTSITAAQTTDPALDSYYRRACGGGVSATLSTAHAAAGSPGSASQPATETATPRARELVSAMLQAHGGMEAWRSTHALQFTHVLMFGEVLHTEWFISHETTEIRTKRSYQDWPLFKGRLAYDGTATWTHNWQIENPPGVNVNSAYTILALPWLTQEAGVLLTDLGRRTLPADPLAYDVVRMTYATGTAEQRRKYYDLYIHPQTHVLRAVAYNITYGAFLDLIGLPKDQQSLGPFLHVFYEHTREGGLLFPSKYDTFDPTQHNAGRHVVIGYALSGSFDASRLRPPKDAVFDRSSPERTAK
ncbi:MAG: hypothetical protein JNJ46_29085 [Myxococcales bacterium]|nr:hypothetical protein [Myxococcales bacterium]